MTEAVAVESPTGWTICGRGVASAQAFLTEKAWRHCVRRAGHPAGECVMSLTKLEEEALGEMPGRIAAIEEQIMRLQHEVALQRSDRAFFLRERDRIEAARGT